MIILICVCVLLRFITLEYIIILYACWALKLSTKKFNKIIIYFYNILNNLDIFIDKLLKQYNLRDNYENGLVFASNNEQTDSNNDKNTGGNENRVTETDAEITRKLIQLMNEGAYNRWQMEMKNAIKWELDKLIIGTNYKRSHWREDRDSILHMEIVDASKVKIYIAGIRRAMLDEIEENKKLYGDSWQLTPVKRKDWPIDWDPNKESLEKFQAAWDESLLKINEARRQIREDIKNMQYYKPRGTWTRCNIITRLEVLIILYLD